jgi:YHS domain-containing protein
MSKGAFHLALCAGGLAALCAVAAEAPRPAIPEPFARFEHMIGSWKGQAVNTANRLKGWEETHAWAWKFAKGTPVGMSLDLSKDKVLARAVLSFDERAKVYHLDGTDAAGMPVAFAGKFDPASKSLVLDRTGSSAGAVKDRLIIRPNANKIRYVLDFDQKEPGAPQYKRVITANLGKEGESFAAGAAAADLPKCILTGGAATMTVSYQGKSYPVCCSGCRDEFNENPEKYAKKAALMAEQAGKTPVKAAASKVGKDDGAFAGLDEDAPKANDKPGAAARPAVKAKAVEPSDSTGEDAAAAKRAARAASALRIAQSLDKAGKTAAALKYYKQVVKDYPGTAQAKTAAARVKALGGS